MSYKVIESFPDAQDACHVYKEGDTYPRNGVTPSKARIAELLGGANNRHRPLIEKVTGKSKE